MASTINDTLHIKTLSCGTFTPPASCIGNAAIPASADIDDTKLVHRFPKDHYQAPGANIAAATQDIHAVYGATGTVRSIKAAVTGVAAGGDRTVTVDLHKSTGGAAFASVLSAPIVLDSGNALRVPEDGTISGGTLVENDVLRLIVTVGGSSGTQPQGLFVGVSISEVPHT